MAVRTKRIAAGAGDLAAAKVDRGKRGAHPGSLSLGDLRSCAEYALEAATEILLNVARLQQIEAAFRARERRRDGSATRRKVARLEQLIDDAEFAFMAKRGIRSLEDFDRLSDADQLKLEAQLKKVRRRAVGSDGVRIVDEDQKQRAAEAPGLDRMTEDLERESAIAQLKDVTTAIHRVGTGTEPVVRNAAPPPNDVVQMVQRRLAQMPSLPSAVDELHALLAESVNGLKINARAVADGFGDPARRRRLKVDIDRWSSLLGVLHPRMGSKQRDGLIARNLGLGNESVVRNIRSRAR